MSITDEPAPTGNDLEQSHSDATAKPSNHRKLAAILSAITLTAVSVLFEIQTHTLGVFDSPLKDARAAVAIGDREGALVKYEAHITRNIKDEEVRQEFVRFLLSEEFDDRLLRVAQKMLNDFQTRKAPRFT